MIHMTARSLWFLALLLTSSLPLSAAAQLPFSITIDARAGLAVPSGEFADAQEGFTSEAGPGFAIGGAAYPTNAFGLFAGYQRTRFGCQQCPVLGLNDSVVLHGLEAGIHLGLPLGDLPVNPWLRGGIIQQTLVFSGFDDHMSSAAAVGYTVGAGLTIPASSGLEINPALRFFALPANFEFTSFPDRSIDVSAFSFDLGLSFRI